MTILELFDNLQRQGIRLWVDGDQLRYQGPPGAITPELRALLVQHKTALHSWLRQFTPAPAALPLRHDPHRTEAPLSFAQQRFWLIQQLAPDLAAYTIPAVLELHGALNVAALEQALNSIVQRHALLRSSFPLIDGRPVQQIQPYQPQALQVSELESCDEAGWNAAVTQQARLAAQYLFDLAHDPPVRWQLLRRNQTRHVLVITLHHIVFDAASLAIFWSELERSYSSACAGAAVALAPPSIQYADYAAWQQDQLATTAFEADLAYWRQCLAGAETILTLFPHARSHVPAQQHGALHSSRLGPELTQQLRALSQREGCTLFMTLLAAFNCLLFRYTGQTDILVGSPVTIRDREELEALIGPFINLLVLRTKLTGRDLFRDLLHQVQQQALDAYEHRQLPFERLVEALSPARELDLHPLFQVLFVFQAASEPPRLPNLDLRVVPQPSTAAKYDLSLTITEYADSLMLEWEYPCDRCDETAIRALAEHFEQLVSGIVANPALPVGRLPLLSPAEHAALCSPGPAITATGNLLHQMVARQASATPDAIAVHDATQQISYRTLNARANRLARYLRRQGSGPEQIVGICLRRSADLLVALLGVLKAGAAYLPLDPAYPTARLDAMIADSRAALVLTETACLDRLPANIPPTICIDRDWGAIAAEPAAELDEQATPANLAYVLYTSGSTGQPKGVAIEHRSVAAFLEWAGATFPLTARKRVLCATSICFDLAVFELFTPLVAGGVVVLVENILHLVELPQAEELTLINTVPSALSSILDSGCLPRAIHTVNVAGEPLPAELVTRLYQAAPQVAMHNLYGPTEATTYSTAGQALPNSEPPTIGQPITGTQVYIVDRMLELVPNGMSGQLLLGGHGLARGYLYQPGLTAAQFIPNPFAAPGASGTRLYRTGDHARRQRDGNLMFIGRKDQQIKLRGFRIELGEVETALLAHPSVRSAAALIESTSWSQQRLAAYVDLKAGTSTTEDALLDFVGAQLPGFMTPSTIVIVPDLPLNANGKIDRSALRNRYGATEPARPTVIAPRSALEQRIAAIWREVLGDIAIGVHDSFFSIGGSSLLLLQVYSRIHLSFDTPIALLDLFRYPTIAALARQLDTPAPAPADRLAHTVQRTQQRQQAVAEQQQRRRRTRNQHDF